MALVSRLSVLVRENDAQPPKNEVQANASLFVTPCPPPPRHAQHQRATQHKDKASSPNACSSGGNLLSSLKWPRSFFYLLQRPWMEKRSCSVWNVANWREPVTLETQMNALTVPPMQCWAWRNPRHDSALRGSIRTRIVLASIRWTSRPPSTSNRDERGPRASSFRLAEEIQKTVVRGVNNNDPVIPSIIREWWWMTLGMTHSAL